MRRRAGGGGGGGLVKSAVWALVCLSLLVALWNGTGGSIRGIYLTLRADSTRVQQTLSGWLHTAPLPHPHPHPASPSPGHPTP